MRGFFEAPMSNKDAGGVERADAHAIACGTRSIDTPRRLTLRRQPAGSIPFLLVRSDQFTTSEICAAALARTTVSPR